MMQGLMMRRAGWARRPAFAAATPRALVRLERPMSALTHQRASASFALQHLRHEHVLAQPAAAAAARMGAQCGGVVVAAACTWGAARALADQRMAACDSKFLHERSAHVVRRTSKPRIVINDDIPMLSRLTRMIRRVLSLMLLSLPLVFGVPLALTLGRLIPLIEELCWEYALRAVHRAGPTYIKLAQWASSRSDLFPEQFCRTFERLHDSVFPHPWRDTQRILARELGPGWESELRLRPEVIGSGCIAQVYKGTLTPKRPLAASGVLTGPMEVAVKVIHPGVEYMVAVDLDIMRSIARALALVPALRWLSLPDVVEDFALQMVWQLDLRQEAHNLQRLHANFSEDRGIHIPLPVMEHTSRDVLIETFEDGVPITQFIESEACCAESKKELSRLGMNSMAKMIFIDNFVHCDLHPGNILVSGTVGNLVMIYLDAGIVKVSAPRTAHRTAREHACARARAANGRSARARARPRARADDADPSPPPPRRSCGRTRTR